MNVTIVCDSVQEKFTVIFLINNPVMSSKFHPQEHS